MRQSLRVWSSRRTLPAQVRRRRGFRRSLTRRRFLTGAGGNSRRPSRPPKQPAPDELSVAAPVSIEVNARPIPSFDTRDRARTRFGALEYRSGLILTSRFRGFGGLSGWRLDAKGERFISFSDHGSWFTGRIVYPGREMTGLADVEAAPMLGARRQADHRARLVRHRVDRARRLAGLYRARARQPDAAIRFQQGWNAFARRSHRRAAGDAQALVSGRPGPRRI